MIFVGRNFGFPSDTSITNFTKYIQISIGHEYTRDGGQCTTDQCMKSCTNVQWRPKLPETLARSSGLSDIYLDHPYITCTPSADVAGGRNITLSIYGQTDDCSTNPLLCGRIDPRKWPSIRTSDNDNNLVHGMGAAGCACWPEVAACNNPVIPAQWYQHQAPRPKQQYQPPSSGSGFKSRRITSAPALTTVSCTELERRTVVRDAIP